MPKTINVSETLQVSLTKSQITPNGELYLEGGIVGGQQVKQTLPNPGSPAYVCYDPDSNNFYWTRIVGEDLRPNGVLIEPFNF